MRTIPDSGAGQCLLQRRTERDDIGVVAVAQAGGVRQQLAKRDRVAGEGGVAQGPAQVGRDVAVEIELPLLHHPHHADPDD